MLRASRAVSLQYPNGNSAQTFSEMISKEVLDPINHELDLRFRKVFIFTMRSGISYLGIGSEHICLSFADYIVNWTP